MRVFVDTNVLISFLLNPARATAVSRVVRAGLGGTFDIVLSQEILDELTRSVGGNPYLRFRIDQADLVEFLHRIVAVADVKSAGETGSLALSRDRNDDFVLLQAIAANVDVILTGDQDLLVLQRIGDIRIMNANGFLQELEQNSDNPSPS